MPLAFSRFDDVQATPEQVAKALRFLPSAPRVLPCVYGQVRGSVSSLQQVGELLRYDPGLTAKVMQIGYGLSATRGHHCFTVEDAINQIGFEQIVSIVATVADGQALARSVSIYGLEADDFWRWSIACALGAELLAEHTGEDTSVAHTAGLMHAIGMVAVDDWILRHGPALMLKTAGMPREYIDSERALLGFTQADVGAALLRLWNFPSTISEAVRLQYSPCGQLGYTRMACLLHTAKWLRSAVCTDDAAPPLLPAAPVLQILRLNPETLFGFVVDLRVRVGEMRNSLERRAA